MDDSERRMRRRVKRVRRRVREGTTFTPQVARNYRWDMWRTPATPQYAYRPADSMTHMFRTKYDMIHQFNADLHQQEIRNIQAETEISKLQHQRKMAEKKTREYEREKILALQDKLAAEHAEEEARLEYKKEKKRLTSEHQAEMRNMRLDHERNRFKSEIAAEKARFLQEEIMQLDKELFKRNLDATKHEVNRFLWEGMYTTDENGEKVMKWDAKPFYDAGLNVEVGEREVLRQRAEWEAEKLVRDNERQIAAIKSENKKLLGQINLEKDPTYRRLLAERELAGRTLKKLQLEHERERQNDRVRGEIHRYQTQVARLKADSKEPSPELVQKRDEAIKELAAAKEQHNIAAEKLRLTRQIVEMQAQIGDPSQLDQQLKDKRQQLNDLDRQMRNVKRLESLDDQIAERLQDYNGSTASMLADVEHWIRELNPILPDAVRREISASTDPTYRMNLLLRGARIAAGQRDQYYDRLRAFLSHVNEVRHDEQFRRDTQAVISRARAQMDQVSGEQEVAVAHQLYATLVDDTPPSRRFTEPAGLQPEHREPQQL